MLSFDNRLNDFKEALRWKNGYEITPTLQSTILDNKRDKLKLLAGAIYKHGLRNYDGYITSDIKYFMPSGAGSEFINNSELIKLVNTLMERYATLHKEYDMTKDKKQIKKRLTETLDKFNRKSDVKKRMTETTKKIENLEKSKELTTARFFNKERELEEYKEKDNRLKYNEALEEYKKIGVKIDDIDTKIKDLTKSQNSEMKDFIQDMTEILGFNPVENVETTEELEEQNKIIEDAIDDNPTLEVIDPDATTTADTVIIPTGDVINE